MACFRCLFLSNVLYHQNVFKRKKTICVSMSFSSIKNFSSINNVANKELTITLSRMLRATVHQK